jgi:hypothetical protein
MCEDILGIASRRSICISLLHIVREDSLFTKKLDKFLHTKNMGRIIGAFLIVTEVSALDGADCYRFSLCLGAPSNLQ